MRPLRSTVFAAVLVTVMLAATACGTTDDLGTTAGGEGSGASTSEPPTTTTAPKSTTTTEPEEPAVRAKAALLTLEDFPAGFDRVPGDTSSSDENFGQCAGGLDDSDKTRAAESSDDFDKGDIGGAGGASYASASSVFTTDRGATQFVDLFGDDAFAACLTDDLTKDVLQDGGEITGEFKASADLGVNGDQDASVSGRFAVLEKDTKRKESIDISFFVVRTGDLVTAVFGLGLGQALDQDLIRDLAGIVGDRQAG